MNGITLNFDPKDTLARQASRGRSNGRLSAISTASGSPMSSLGSKIRIGGR